MLTNVTRLHPGPQFTPDQASAFAASLGAMINAGLELLDVLGGDPDIEPNGDELDNSFDEDAPLFHDEAGTPNGMGPGCPISDPDYGAEEAGERAEY